MVTTAVLTRSYSRSKDSKTRKIIDLHLVINLSTFILNQLARNKKERIKRSCLNFHFPNLDPTGEK